MTREITSYQGSTKNPSLSEVFSLQKARDWGISPVHWKKANTGLWGVTDDEYVAFCKSRKTYTDRRNRQRDLITFSFARAWSSSTKLLYNEFKLHGGWGQTSPGSWIEKEVRRTRTRIAVVLYVEMLLTNGVINWRVLGRAYRADQRKPHATIKRLFRQEKVKTMIRNELRIALSNKGITEEKVLGMYLGAYDKASEIGRPSEMRAVANDLAEIIGMNSKDGPNVEYKEEEWDFELALEKIEQSEKRRQLLASENSDF